MHKYPSNLEKQIEQLRHPERSRRQGMPKMQFLKALEQAHTLLHNAACCHTLLHTAAHCCTLLHAAAHCCMLLLYCLLLADRALPPVRCVAELCGCRSVKD